MRILTTNKKDFSSINTIIAYSTPVFPLPGSRSYGKPKVYYRYKSNEIIEKGFIEYGFNFKPDKLKYNDTFAISMMDKESSEILGTDHRSLEALEKTLFPTVSGSTDKVDYGFFSSTSIQSQELYVIDLPEGITRIELYEEISLPPKSSKTPSAIIEFGPDPDNPNNPNDMYEEIDPRRNSRSGEADISEWARLIDEIRSKKLVWFFITTEKGQSSINLSYSVWRNDINAERNLRSFAVRNDLLNSITKTVKNIEIRDELVIETGTGTILANDRPSELPILRRKLERIKNSRGTIETWNPRREYSMGSEIIHSGKNYVSILQRNIGNVPGFGLGWISSEDPGKHLTYRFQFQIIPNGSLSIPNSGPFISISGNTHSKEFILEEMAGWKFDSLFFGDRKLSETDGDFEIRNSGTGLISTKSITIKNLGKLFKSSGPGPKNFIFCQVPNPITVIFGIQYKGTYGKLMTFPELNFKGALDNETGEALEYELGSSETFSEYIIKKPSQEIKYLIGQLPEGIKVDEITKTGTRGKIKLDYELDSSRNLVIRDNQVSHSLETILVSVSEIEFNVSVSSGPGIETSTSLESASYGSSITEDKIRFYSVLGESGRPRIKVIYGDVSEVLGPGVNKVTLGENTKTELYVSGPDNGIYSIGIKNIVQDIKLEITHDN